MLKAKPCPFCGETPDTENEAHFNGEANSCKWGALICGCGAQGPDTRTEYKDWRHWGNDAIELWNARVETKDAK